MIQDDLDNLLNDIDNLDKQDKQQKSQNYYLPDDKLNNFKLEQNQQILSERNKHCLVSDLLKELEFNDNLSQQDQKIKLQQLLQQHDSKINGMNFHDYIYLANKEQQYQKELAYQQAMNSQSMLQRDLLQDIENSMYEKQYDYFIDKSQLLKRQEADCDIDSFIKQIDEEQYQQQDMYRRQLEEEEELYQLYLQKSELMNQVEGETVMYNSSMVREQNEQNCLNTNFSFNNNNNNNSYRQ